MAEANVIEDLRHQEIQKTVKVKWLARWVSRLYVKFGEYLYQKGFISQIVDVDSLTGAYNRNFFERWVPKLLAQSRRSGVQLAFVNFDVNDLKKTNDSEGHNAGNILLRRFVRVLSRGLRESDLIFRVGGDEFVAILWSCDATLAQKKIEKIKTKLEKKKVYFSFGVVEAETKKSLTMMVNEADELMYEMKRKMKGKRGVR